MSDLKNGIRSVTLFGSALCTPDSREWAEAEATGEALARAGYEIVNGGYGGTMEASARGARRAGGRVTAITVATFSKTPNSYSTETVVAPTLFARLEELLERGGAYVIFPGGTGTLTEFALAWEFALKRGGTPKPLVLLGDFWLPVVGCILRASDFGTLGEWGAVAKAWPPYIHQAASPADVVDFLVQRTQ